MHSLFHFENLNIPFHSATVKWKQKSEKILFFYIVINSIHLSLLILSNSFLHPTFRERWNFANWNGSQKPGPCITSLLTSNSTHNMVASIGNNSSKYSCFLSITSLSFQRFSHAHTSTLVKCHQLFPEIQ